MLFNFILTFHNSDTQIGENFVHEITFHKVDTQKMVRHHLGVFFKIESKNNVIISLLKFVLKPQ